ncbi:MAG: hypothetical protein EXR71_11790 [Myxococcales bacterium]|nr:hypothetical protein [Myxococcales bacterium]
MRVFHHPVVIQPEQIDILGHLNNAAYLMIFEAARWAVLRETGASWDQLAALGVSPVVLEIDLKFRREVRLGDTVAVESSFRRTGPRRFAATQRLVDAAGKLRASAELIGTFFDVRTRRIIDPPTALLGALGLEEPAQEPPRVQGLGGVFLYADDVDALAAWYRRHFELELEVWGDARGIELPSLDRHPSGRLATTTFALFRAGTPLPAVRNGRVNFRVPDLDAVLARLADAGVRLERGPEDHGRFAWAWDPEGNKLELWEPPLLDHRDDNV